VTFDPNYDPSEIIANAYRALEAVDERIAAARQERKAINQRIIELIESRKPIARIVSAAKPRTRHRQDVDHE
jgi:hypothetical protein